MYRLRANSRATISSTAIFLSQQSRQYFSSPRGSETSLALQSAHRTCATDLRDMAQLYYWPTFSRGRMAGAYIFSTYSLTMRRALKRGATLTMALRTYE